MQTRFPAFTRRLALLGFATIGLCQFLPVSISTAAADDLIVYNAQHETLAKAWIDGFTRDTGIKVTVRNGDDSEMSNQILQEGDASPADVFLTENSPAMVQLAHAGRLAPIDGATMQQVAPQFRPASGDWVGIAARSTVFIYNKDKLKEADLPTSLLDLADPAWKGRWGASPTGADFQAIVSAFLSLKGEEATLAWLKSMKANFTAYRGNGTVMKAVNAGQIDGGVIYHYYWFTDQAKTGENSKNTALHYFKHQDPGAFVSTSGGGILKTAKHPKEAQAFLKWITGKGGQDVLKTGTSFEYAVGDGADSNAKLTPVKELEAPAIDTSKLNSEKVIELMTEAGLL